MIMMIAPEPDRCRICKRIRVENEVASYLTLCYVCKLMFKHADKEHCLMCNQPKHMMGKHYLNFDHFDSDDIDISEFETPAEPAYNSYKICYDCARFKLDIQIAREMWTK